LAIDSNDFHPNAAGHARLAARLDRALGDLPELRALWGNPRSTLASAIAVDAGALPIPPNPPLARAGNASSRSTSPGGQP
jgi:hypothetical protein